MEEDLLSGTDSSWSEAVLRHREFLIKHMEPNFGLVEKLNATEVLSDEYKAEIDAENTVHKRNTKLLECIQATGQYESFVEALERSSQTHVVNYLKKNGIYAFDDDWPLLGRERSILRANQETLMEILDVQDLVIRLYSAGVINFMQREFISSKKASYKKNRALLDILTRRSIRDYKKTIRCLHETQQSHIAQILEEGGVVVRVHAVIPDDRTEDEIISQVSSILGNRSTEESRRILEGTLNVIAMKKGKSIIVYVYCKTLDELLTLQNLKTSGKLVTVLQKLFIDVLFFAKCTEVAAVNPTNVEDLPFTEISQRSQIEKMTAAVDEEEYENWKMYYLIEEEKKTEDVSTQDQMGHLSLSTAELKESECGVTETQAYRNKDQEKTEERYPATMKPYSNRSVAAELIVQTENAEHASGDTIYGVEMSMSRLSFKEAQRQLRISSIPSSVRRTLAMHLDAPCESNWEYLAEELEIMPMEIMWLKNKVIHSRTTSPTFQLFDEYLVPQDYSLEKFLQALQKIKNFACVRVLTEEYEKGAFDEVLQRIHNECTTSLQKQRDHYPLPLHHHVDRITLPLLKDDVDKEEMKKNPDGTSPVRSVESSYGNFQQKSFSKDERCIRVFVTYAEDSQRHMKRVVRLCDCLKKNNFSVSIDVREKSLLSQDKKGWCDKQFKEADYVLVLISPKYYTDVTNLEEHNMKLKNESTLNTLYIHRCMQAEYMMNGCLNRRFIPILMPDSSKDHAPVWLRNTTIYIWPDQYKNLFFYMMYPPQVISDFKIRDRIAKTSTIQRQTTEVESSVCQTWKPDEDK